jgi:hypothetical protein
MEGKTYLWKYATISVQNKNNKSVQKLYFSFSLIVITDVTRLLKFDMIEHTHAYTLCTKALCIKNDNYDDST